MNDSRILPDELAKSLALKLQGDQLVLFVGAGISFQSRAPSDPVARMPLWRDLANAVAKEFGQNLANFDHNLLDMFDDIALTEGRDTLEESVRRALRDDIFEPSEVHRLIAALPWNRVFTTNYDSLLKRAMNEADPIVADADYMKLRRPIAEQPKLIHLHGDLADMHTLTGEDFNIWDDRHPLARSALVDAGLNKTFLFIGYSNSDPHLRHGLFPWIRKLGQGLIGQNYAWMWKASVQQIRVIDRTSKIAVQSFSDDNDWLAALQQIQNEYLALKTARAGKPLLPSQPKYRAGAEVGPPPRLNGYKLFYHRMSKGISVRELARRSGVDWRRINRLEAVSKTRKPSEECFAVSNPAEIMALERAMDLRGILEFGAGDDFLATYIMFHKVNSGSMGRRGSNRQLTFKPDTKAVVFDFGGTLTLPNAIYNTWERLWLSVDYTIEQASNLHRLFIAGKITHQQWCDETCVMLRQRGFSKSHLEEIAAGIQPVHGLKETIAELSDRAIPTFIVSGSIRRIVQKILGESYAQISEVKCNDIIFDADGLISEIRGHDFDFAGKARFITRVINDRRCLPIEVLFVGNSLNDHWAIQSGARTLCVNPSHTDYTNSFVWSNYIKEMSDLQQILRHV